MKEDTRSTPLRAVLLILSFERLRLTYYDDGVGVWTVGWGHAAGRVKPSSGAITEDEANLLFMADLAIFERAVSNLVKVPLSDLQFGALVSFTFNVGASALSGSTLLRLLNSGDHGAVPAQMKRWTKGTVDGKSVELGGLVRRRAAESALWIEGSA